MAFPDEPLPVGIELQIDGVWTDITEHVYLRDRITITRGRGDEADQVEPASCKLTLNNRDGRYSPKNPRSPYYGLIGRNTPIRVYVEHGDVALTNLGGAGARVTCPDASGLDITGDIDIRVDLTANDWSTGGNLAGKYAIDQRSWILNVGSDDLLALIWSPDGTLASRQFALSTEPIPMAPGRRALRATLDVDNGSGGHTVRFYTAPTIAGPWTQLGDAVTGSGTTSIYAGTASVEVGDVQDLEGHSFAGRYHAVQILSGIGGTAVADVDFSAQTPGATSFTDDAGNTWTLQDNVVLDRRSYRFAGEVSSWLPRWDVSGRDRYVQIEAAGILRRLHQGAEPLKSALRREIEGADAYTAWWPLEDASGATQAAPGYPGLPPLLASGDVSFGAEETGGTAGGVSLGTDGRLLNAPVSGGSSTGWVVAAWYLPPPPSEWEALHASPLIQWQTTGSAALWTLYAAFDGSGVSLVVDIADSGNSFIGGDIGSASAITSGSGLPVQVLCRAVQSGSNVSVVVQADGVTVVSLTLTSQTCGRVSHIGLNTRLEEDHGLTFLGRWSHLLVAPSSRYLDVIGHIDAGQGYAGETALDRAARIAAEEGVPLDTIGDADDSQPMGPQRVASALDLITEAADADLGTLYERLSPPGLTLRARAADYNTPAITLSYDDLAPPLEPTDDDQDVANDVTVSRPGGSSARAVDETSPLSVLAPPDGIGRYQTSRELNLASDAQLVDVATWLLHLGTQDAARYPVLHLDLHAKRHLIDDAVGLDIRSRIRLDDLPEWLPPGPVDLLVEGYTETIGAYDWDIELNCSPGDPWNVAAADDLVWGRADTDGSELAAPVGAGDTSLSVAITDGPLWTTDADDLPLDIIVGGEVVTVTDISGASSPQIFTVTRAVNGISKSHAAGADVRLAYPAIAAL